MMAALTRQVQNRVLINSRACFVAPDCTSVATRSLASIRPYVFDAGFLSSLGACPPAALSGPHSPMLLFPTWLFCWLWSQAS
uniref:Uncharacterized protein n=1 Tax=Rhipicephalus appendiculatus TaxID=34631 RepID=A0A131YD30_RHIAP